MTTARNPTEPQVDRRLGFEAAPYDFSPISFRIAVFICLSHSGALFIAWKRYTLGPRYLEVPICWNL